MSQRTILYVLLGTVAAAAAVLSFDALRELAVTCGFSDRLAWLLPVVVDAGAASGSLAWLGSACPPIARAYGRALALVLLASSVGGNALGHGLQAYGARPHWLVVVGVSAIAPAVLGALVHLVVLVGRPPTPVDEQPAEATPMPADRETAPAVAPEPPAAPTLPPVPPIPLKAAELVASGAGRRRVARELGVTEHEARSLIARHREMASV